MALVRQIARRYPEPRPEEQLFGIEVEYENVMDISMPPDRSSSDFKWEVITDGSLRNEGREFLSPRPWTRRESLDSIDVLWQIADFNQYRATARTGIHVHVDFSWSSFAQVRSALALYCYAEPFMFRWLGGDRDQCIYCIPWYEAFNEVDTLARGLFEQNLSDIRWLTTTNKYSALYVQPLHRFGTIEFRQAPTFADREQMRNWLNMLNNFAEFAKDHTAEYMVEYYYTHGIHALLSEAGLGPLLTTPEEDDEFFDGFISLELAERFSSWTPDQPAPDDPWESFELTDGGQGAPQGARMANMEFATPNPRPTIEAFYDEAEVDYYDDYEEEY